MSTIIHLASTRFDVDGRSVYACDACAPHLHAAGVTGFKVDRRRSCEVCPVRRAVSIAPPRMVDLDAAVRKAAVVRNGSRRRGLTR